MAHWTGGAIGAGTHAAHLAPSEPRRLCPNDKVGKTFSVKSFLVTHSGDVNEKDLDIDLPDSAESLMAQLNESTRDENMK